MMPGLVAGVEGQVGVVPVARDAQAAELVALDADPLHRLGVAEVADLGVAHRGGLRAEVLHDLVLDRQAVAVPAGDVRAVEPAHRERADDEVLEHLVEQVPHVDLAVGVGRAVVEDLPRRGPRGPARICAVEVGLAPAGLDLAARGRSGSPSSRTG